MLHAKAMVTVIAFDIYLEIAEGNLDPLCKLDKKQVVSFYRFREKLSKQMLCYDPRERLYPGDEKFRVSTKQSTKQRSLPRSITSPGLRTPRRPGSVASTTSGITVDDVKSADKRLCGDLGKFCSHVESIIQLPLQNKRVCVVCGNTTRYACGLCDKALHYPSFTSKSDGKTIPCFLNYHNTNYFGLAMEDHKLVGKKRKQFLLPTHDRIHEHAVAMQRLRATPLSPRPLPPLLPTAATNATAATTNRADRPNSNKPSRRRLTTQQRQDGWNNQCV
jgi:hypothetical protein